MLDANFSNNTLTFPETRPYPIEPQETSGTTFGSQAIYRYSLKESDYPILIIIDEIADASGDKIPSGHYELALSDERDFLIILQSKEPLAIVPVFRLEEDKDVYKKPNRKEKKRLKRLKKEREDTNAKRARVGMPPDEDKIYMEASIEYIKDGDYYLLKYERGSIRAWGAIKAYDNTENLPPKLRN